MLNIGENAPNFTLYDQDGRRVSLTDFLGKRVVLYFYSKDNTPGCTRQACAFAARHDDFDEMNIPVIGISKDSSSSHLKFAQKYSLPFVLLSDPERIVADAYGVLQEKKLYGKASIGVVRSALIIGKDGKIEKIMPRVNPDTNAEEILNLLKNGELK